MVIQTHTISMGRILLNCTGSLTVGLCICHLNMVAIAQSVQELCQFMSNETLVRIKKPVI